MYKPQQHVLPLPQPNKRRLFIESAHGRCDVTFHIGHWTSARVSVAAGSIAASQRACEDPFLNVDSFDVVLKQHTTADGFVCVKIV